MLNDAETKNLLNRHFDLVILDGAFPECAVSLVHAFRVPFMMINTVGLYTGSLSLAGNPAPYSTTPIFFSSFTDEMNIYQRMLNTIYTVFAYSVHRVSIYRKCVQCSLVWFGRFFEFPLRILHLHSICWSSHGFMKMK